MADFAGAVAAIKARLEANWATTPIGYPNGDPAATRDASGNPQAWVLAEIVGAANTIHAAGKAGSVVYVQDGLIHAHVFVPKGSGDATARTHAVALGEIFRGKLFYDDVTPGHYVRSWAPRIDGGGDGSDDGLWFRVTATIPFEYWHLG
jgi:hypothetical protein